MNGRLVAVAVILAAAAGGAGLAVYQTYAPSRTAVPDAAGATDSIPDFAFQDLEGRTRQSTEWTGRVLVLNFWATWCPPCREEVPTFVEHQARYGDAGLQFVGVAVDQPEPVREFADDYGVNYPLLIGGTDAVELSKRLGNRFSGLPFTVVFDREGQVRFRQPGEMTAAMIETHVIPLLELDQEDG